MKGINVLFLVSVLFLCVLFYGCDSSQSTVVVQSSSPTSVVVKVSPTPSPPESPATTQSPAVAGSPQSAPSLSKEVKKGEKFTIDLTSNPTTGYKWELTEKTDDKIVKFIGSDYKAHEPQMTGSGGTEIWTFEAVGEGKTVIKMKYARSWEKDTPPAEERNIEVTVTP